MMKLTTLLSVILAVNLVAAPAAKKAAKKAAVAKPVIEQKAPAAEEIPVVAPEVLLPEGTEAAPQVNPQPAPQPTIGETTAAAPMDANAPVITGTIDIRPSHYADKGLFVTENYIDLGYKVGNSHFIIEQDFDTNLYNPQESDKSNFTLKDTLVRYKLANILESEDKVYSLSYELRAFLPTYAPAREAGMITQVRNYAKFAAKVSDSVTLSAWEIPIVHIYSQAGTAAGANPGFENRFYLMADWNISDAWSFSFPLMLNSTRSREFNGAEAAWSHFVWTWPELDYALSKNYTLGVAWTNAKSFMTPDMGEFQISEALKTGEAQLVFRATL